MLMNIADIETLPAAQRIALAYLGNEVRTKLAAGFALDFRLSRIVANSSEPMLAQMRLAWWREALQKPAAQRPQGDLVLAGISENWVKEEEILIKLVDAWEEFLLAETLDEELAIHIAHGRGAFIEGVMQSPGGYWDKDGAKRVAALWALADTAAHCSNDHERKLIVELAIDLDKRHAPMPRNLRGIAVLNALSRHAIKRGGRPLAEGRVGALVAFRAGLLGS